MDAQTMITVGLVGFIVVVFVVPYLLLKIFGGYLRKKTIQFGGRVESEMAGFFFRKMGEQVRQEFQNGTFDFEEFSVEKAIKKVDADYNEKAFLNMAEDTFRKYCDAMSNNDSRILKAIETEDLFLKHNHIIEKYKSQRKKKMHQIEQINSKRILNFSAKHGVGSVANLWVEIKAEMLRYDATLSGSPLSDFYPEVRYEIFQLGFEKQNIPKVKNQSLNCPNCGAPHTIQTVGICPYCRTMVVVAKDNWLLCDVKRA